MTSLRQYQKGIYYYSKALFIYAGLKRYLNQSFKADLEFKDQTEETYFYHSPYYNRTKQYMHANHFFGELLCLLRGRRMQKDERRNFANLSSCAPIFDDFFENNNDLPHIHQLLIKPNAKDAQNNKEQLAVHFLNNILASLPDKSPFIEAAKQLFQAQKDSKKQKDAELSEDRLLDISIRKGGYSGLMYSLLLNHSSHKELLDIGYDLGSFGQLMDDVFDIYDDRADGIRTFANQAKTVDSLYHIIKETEDAIVKKIKEMNSSQYETSHFLNVFKIFSTTIQLALEQYSEIEKEQGIGPSDCLLLNRDKWIVDMESKQNIWKLITKSVKKL